MSDLSRRLMAAKGDQSIDAIAKRATSSGHPLSRSVVAKYLRGDHGPRVPEATLLGLAAGLGLDVRELRQLAGRPAGELGPYVPTQEAASLTRNQRDALDQLIRAFTSEGSGNEVGSTEAEKTVERPPAPVVTHPRFQARVGDETIDMDELEGAARSGYVKHNPQLAGQEAAGEDNQDEGGFDPA